MLRLDNVHTYYGKSHILHGVSIEVAARRGGRPARPQRRRQVHHAQDHHRSGAALGGHHHLRGPSHRRRGSAPPGPPGDRLGARGSPHLPAAHRPGESARRSRSGRGERAAQEGAAGARLRELPPPARAPGPGRRHALRRRAADAGHRAGHDAGAQDHPPRRAHRGADAPDGLRDPRDRRRPPPGGRGHPPRGAERSPHPGGLEPRVHHGEGRGPPPRVRPPRCAPISPSSTSTWGSRRVDAIVIQTVNGHRQRDDPGPGRLGAHPDLRHHGRGELRPRRPRHAGRLHRGHHHGHDRQLLAGPAGRRRRHRGVRRRAADQHARARCWGAIPSPPSSPPSASPSCSRSTRCGSGGRRRARSSEPIVGQFTSCSTCSTRGTGSPPRSWPRPSSAASTSS